MANISDKTAQIRQAILGKDVRESLASGIEAINTEAENTTQRQTTLESNMAAVELVRQNAEVIRIENENTRIDDEESRVAEHIQMVSEVDGIKSAYDAATKANLSVEVTNARTSTVKSKAFSTLDARLEESEQDHASLLSENAQQFAEIELNKADKTEVNSLATGKADIAYVNTQIATVASGAPKGTYATLADLQTAKPTGDTGNYVVALDGHIYNWNGSAWTDTGIQYQSTGIADNTIKYSQVYSKTAFSNINPSNLFDNPTLENSLTGWLIINNDSQTGTEISLTDSFSKGAAVPVAITGNSLAQRIPLTKLVTGEYKVKCRKKTNGSSYNGRLIVQLSNSIGTTLYEIYRSNGITTSLMEYTFSFNKESLLATYPTAVYLTISFGHSNPSADCIFYEPFIGLTSGGTDYNNFKYESLQALNKLISTFDGDSICQGVSNGGGYAKVIAEFENMTVENKGIGGGTIAYGTYYADGTTPRHWICNTVNDMRSDADFAIWEGGRNDYGLNVPLGFLTTDYVSAVDNTTFYGALESLFRQALLRFKGKKVGFIIIHKANAEPYTPNSIGLKFEDYYNAIIATCNKYSIPVCDLYKTSGLITAINDLKTTYTDSSDGLHPNALGYEKYYAPKISAWLKTL